MEAFSGYWLILIGVIVGGGITGLLLGARASALRGRLRAEREEREKARADLERKTADVSGLNAEVVRLRTVLEHERKAAEEKLDVINRSTEELCNTFKALSSEALQSNNRSFLDLAKATLEKFQAEAVGDLESRQKAVESLVGPVKESLDKVDVQIQELEKARRQAYGGLTEQVKSLLATQEKLHAETGNLVKALRKPSVRGRWGEIQLRRVVEIAGMLPYCDFSEQESIPTEEGRLRPDLLVKLPGGKNVVVDAKAPLQAYLDALEEEEEEGRRVHLKDHARQIRDHMGKLSSKLYWEQFDSSPEFVVMFLPGENFFSAALEQSPGLIEEGVGQRVILATPTTLIALLRAIAFGWRQEKIAESAQIISDLGRDLHQRLGTLANHFSKIGKGLDGAVDAYNKAVGSFEGRVLVAARRFTELGTDSSAELPTLQPVERVVRRVQSADGPGRGGDAGPPPEEDGPSR